MPAELEPPELAARVDYAERSRTGDWSLRSALVRYAESQPVRVSQVLELVRRLDAALHAHAKVLAKQGPAVWAAVGAGAPPAGVEPALLGLLEAAGELDQLAEVMVAWAVDRHGARPDAVVDATVASVTTRLDDLGVAREERQGPPRRRRG